MLTPNASAGMSTSRPPTAASTSPLTSAAGAVQAGQAGTGAAAASARGRGSLGVAGGGRIHESFTDLGHPVPGGELGGEQRQQQDGQRQQRPAHARAPGQPPPKPDAQREQHDQKAR